MTVSYTLFSLFLLLVSAEFNEGLAVYEKRGVRIPEHTCHKLVGMNICDLKKCNKECSKEPLGVGECRNALCSCTYFCKQPPV